MHDRVVALLDTADRALAQARGTLPDVDLDRAATAVQRVRSRIDYPEDLALVALVGGTGSGKSSLFNSILEVDRAEVGGVRPTTSTAMVSIPESRIAEMDGYLDRIGLEDRGRHLGLDWLVLIDMPDTDSVQTDHRLQVESLLPNVDVVVWVTDVEKYRDHVLHNEFIRPLSGYQSQFLFALNQMDRIPPEEVSYVLSDLGKALSDDGVVGAKVVAVSANPPLSPPLNIPELVEEMKTLVEGSVVGKAILDLKAALGEMVGKDGRSGTGFEDRWENARTTALEMAIEGDITGAGRLLADFFSEIAEAVTGDASETAMGLSAHIGEILRALVEAEPELAPRDTARRRWFWNRKRSADEPDVATAWERIAVHLDEMMDAELRPQLRQRALAIAELANLAIQVNELSDDDAS